MTGRDVIWYLALYLLMVVLFVASLHPSERPVMTNSNEGMAIIEHQGAECRSCRRQLRGKPYYMGGMAYLPEGGRAPSNYYGGYVCSRSCDYHASLELEQSMPGHGYGQTRVGTDAMRRINANWPDA